MKAKKSLWTILIAANAFALFYLLFLAYYNSLLLDDLGYVSMIKEKGFSYIKYMYFGWQGRFGSLTVSVVLYKIAILLNNLWPLTLLLLFLGYGCFYLLFRFMFSALNKGFALLLSVTAYNLSILGLLEFSTFYWLCTSPYIFLVPLTALLVYAVFNTRLNPYMAGALILLLSYIVGGGVEDYTPLVILYLGVVLLFRIKKNGIKSIFKQRSDRQLIVALFLLSVCCIIMILAPGNKVRMSVDAPEQTTGIYLFVKTGGILIKFLFAIGFKMIYYIIAFPVFYWAGCLLQEKKAMLSCKYVTGKQFVVSCFLLLLVLYIALLPIVYSLSRLPMSLRNFSYISAVMVAFISYWGVMTGYKYHRKKILLTTMIAGCLCLTGISCWLMNRDFDKVIVYRASIEKLDRQLLQLKKEGFEGTAYLEPVTIKNDRLSLYSRSWNFLKKRFNYMPEKELEQTCFPYEKYSFSAKDTKDWRNQFMQKYYDVKFDILSKE